jgi:type I restriction enzyme S subunit
MPRSRRWRTRSSDCCPRSRDDERVDDMSRPLWTLVQRRDEFDRPDLPLLTVVSEHGVRVRDLSDGRTPSEDLSGYRVVHPGDLVVNKMWARFGAYGVADQSGIISPAYWVLTPRAGTIEPRFLHHLLRSAPYRAEIWRRSKDLPPNGFDLPWDQFKTIVIPVPPVKAQRATADYLDRETTRIDALIAAKRRMVELLEERWQGVLEMTIQSLVRQCGDTPLKHVCREVVVGIVITPSAWYADSGIPAIRGTNVSPGAISLEDLVYLTPEGHALHPKSRLRSGDVVVVRTGQAGAAAVVPPELEGSNCIDLVIIRLSPEYSPQFLEYVLNSDWMQKHIDEYSVGTIQSHFNVGVASRVPVPRASRPEQDAAVARLHRERRWVTGMVGVLNRQVALLQERRQALITAAVTGELDIPEAA